jgi:predicted permease
VTFPLSLPGSQYDGPRSERFFVDLLQRLESVPGIEAVGFGQCAPVSGGCNATRASFPDKPPVAPGREPSVGIHWASPQLFKAMAIPLVRGRTFTDLDRAGQPKVIVINETAARTLFGGEDPIGQKMGVGQGGFNAGAEVIGIVRDVRYRAVEQAPTADVYVPLLQSPRGNGIVFVRSRLDPGAIIPAVRAEIRALDRDLPVANVKTMGARFGDATWRTRLSADLLALFAALALILAAIGLYGVMAQTVEQRTREIGVRLALGAERRNIFALVLGRALAIASIGVVLGVGLALLSTRFLDTLLYQVEANDPATLTVLAIGSLGIAALASYLPARRAARVDPWTSLRAD